MPASILLAGFDADIATRLAARLEPEVPVRIADDADRAQALLDRSQIGVIALGEGLAAEAAQQLLRDAMKRPEADLRCHLVLAAGTDPGLFQDFIDSDQLYYLSQNAPSFNDIASLLKSALHHHSIRSMAVESVDDGSRDADSRRVLEMARHLAGHPNVESVVPSTVQAICELVAAERASCLLYDVAAEILWSPSASGEERRESAVAGLVSFVLRTNSAVQLERVGDDPRYDPEADNESGPDDDRFLAVPVATADSQVLAVLVALRAGRRAAFEPRDREVLELLAEQLAPIFHRFALQARLDQAAAGRAEGMSEGAGKLFRAEAIAHQMQGAGEQGDVLQISPAWTPWAYRLVVAVFVSGFLYTLLGSTHEYATGPAVVRVEGRTDVTATLAGTVMAIEVTPGQAVRAGQPLVRFYGAQEATELERIRREFELGLLGRLRDPTDPSTERALGTLRPQLRMAEARLAERLVRAPRAGVVSDLRVRVGQHLNPGQVILSFLRKDSELTLIAMLPGHYRPLLRPGMTLRLELEGYRYAYQHLRVTHVGDEVVGPGEARRFLGAGIGDAIPLNGPVIFVHGRLPRAFESGGHTYAFHDGILGTAEVRVRSERILPVLLPGLKPLFNDVRHASPPPLP